MQPFNDFLDENAVVKHVVTAIASAGWINTKFATTTQAGLDVVAERGRERLYVEAKGITSSQASSNRYGVLQTPSQIFIQVAAALLKTAEIRSAEPGAEVLIAVPDHRSMRTRLGRIEPMLRQTRIGILWTSIDGNVSSWNTSVLQKLRKRHSRTLRRA